MTVRVVGGTARGMTLKASRGWVRPTSQLVRGAIFNRLALAGLKDSIVLDLYAGTGALGLEALSRGARHTDFVEANARQCTVLRANLTAADMTDRARVFNTKVERALELLGQSYDFVFLDPPYAQGIPRRVMERLARIPLLHPGSMVILEHASKVSPPSTYPSLQLDQDRHYGGTSVAFYVTGGE